MSDHQAFIFWGNAETKFFYELSPDHILTAIEKLKIKTTGRLQALNSMENRVYDFDIDTKSFYLLTEIPDIKQLVVKFYRPGRWSKEQILEEHDFLLQLEESEIPVIAPLNISGETLFLDTSTGLYYALFLKKGGRAPDEFSLFQMETIGRTLARIHQVGAEKIFQYRLGLHLDQFIKSNAHFLIHENKNNPIPSYLVESFTIIFNKIYECSKKIIQIHEEQTPSRLIRLHGDCHFGNIIYRPTYHGESFDALNGEEQTLYHFLDFDDSINGWAVWDIWPLIRTQDEYGQNQLQSLIKGYEDIRPFPYQELKLIEIFRTMKMINYYTWIAKRFDDPAFKAAFGFYDASDFWDQRLQDFKNQLELIQEIEIFN